MSEKEIDFLQDLNEPQREAVMHAEGPCLIVAGAGSGKTRALTYRIAHLIREQGIHPASIMALTFTNKAAKNMRERIEKIAGKEARSLWMGTFHSVFARILRNEAQHLGYESSFSIYDTDDSKQVIKTVVKEMSLDEDVYKPPRVLNRISMAKTKIITWKAYQQDAIIAMRDKSSRMPMLGELYKRYVMSCFRSNAMDFDDLLFNTYLLFKKCPEVLEHYQKRFSYVLVDEFQDTNRLQYLIVKSLTDLHQNLCVVGDDSQSIYAFRGATIANILQMKKDYPKLYTVRLEQNYRSSENIVKAAQSVIDKNEAKIPKNLWTKNLPGERVELLEAYNEHDEARLIATNIFYQKRQFGCKESETAILYRTNSQSRVLEESLRKAGLNYRIYGGLSFYQRKEVKDLLAYLRVLVNPLDVQALRRIINYPRRGIGKDTVDKVMDFALRKETSLWDALRQASAFLSPRTASSIEDFIVLMENLRAYAQKHDASEVADQVALQSGLLEAFKKTSFDMRKNKDPESLEQNVRELLKSVREFVDDEEEKDKSLHAFLQKVSLLTDADTKQEGEDEAISLMTVHAAKGLEFKVVFVAGLDEGLFPMLFEEKDSEELEEERRLFYVAVTRAEERLFLCHAASRYLFGAQRASDRSRFIDEIDKAYLHIQQYVSQKASDSEKYRTKHLHAQKYSPQASSDFESSDIAHLQVGLRVEHPRFGHGIILALDRRGTEQGVYQKALVNFDKRGEKNLLLNFARLRIIQ